MTEVVLEIKGLEVEYDVGDGRYAALHDVDLAVRPREILGVVGESGSGKSTFMSALLRILPANGRISAGKVALLGRDVSEASAEELRRLRGADIAMISQDPLTSLNPVITIERMMLDVLRAHGRPDRPRKRTELRKRAVEALAEVGIPDAAERISYYPHQFSGGMRQRIMIATALMLEPAVLIADEPTSALDVTLEAQILELMKRLREQHGTTIIFVSHDLGVVSQICDRVVVMYAGRVVEENDVVSIFEQPKHPYTRALLASVPSFRRRGDALAAIPGRVPSLAALPDGCKFSNRCGFVQPVCQQGEPRLVRVAGGRVRCTMHDPESGYEHGDA